MFLSLLLVALSADNVRVETPKDGSTYQRHAFFRDIAAHLVDENEVILVIEPEQLCRLAADALGRILAFSSPNQSVGSGAPAEWIGQAIHAVDKLPRFDTEEFLAHATKETLVDIATARGIEAKGTSKTLRQRLTGKAADWYPPGSEFHAEGLPDPEQVTAPTQPIYEWNDDDEDDADATQDEDGQE